MPVEHEYARSVRHVGSSGWLPYAGAGVLAIIGLIALGAYNRRERLEAATPKTLSIAAITANPKDYFGRAATVNGRVVQVLSPKYYTVTDSGGELLVYSPKGNPDVPSRERHPTLAPTDTVRAIGDIKRYEPPASSLAFNANFVRFKGQPILMAQTNNVTTPAILSDNFHSPKPPRATGPLTLSKVVSDLQAIAQAKDRVELVGSRVQVKNVTVVDVNSDRGFWVRLPNGERLFCRLHRGLDDGDMEWMVKVKENQIATLNGVLEDPPSRRFMDRNWGLNSAEAREVSAFKVYLKVDGIVLSRPAR